MKKQIIYLFLTYLMALPLLSKAQNVGIGTSTPANSALLDLSSTSKGLLTPRMTSAQRNAITGPEFGLIVFDTDKGTLMFFDGVKWRALSFTNENNTPTQTRIVDNTNHTDHRLGHSVAISGNYAVVGACPAYFEGGNPTDTGAVYVFFKDAQGWQLQARLGPSDAGGNSGDPGFGTSVAIEGDYIVVGNPDKDVDSNPRQGKVYIYKRNGTAWTQQTSLANTGGSPYDDFGKSLDILEGVLAIGDPNAGVGGGVFIYRVDAGGIWNFEQMVTSPLPQANAGFGFSLSLNSAGDYLLVGEPFRDTVVNGTLRTEVGAAYMFENSGGSFGHIQKFEHTGEGDWFGLSVSYGNVVAIAAPFNNYNPATSAAVYIYNTSGSTVYDLVETLYLEENSGGIPTSLFGGSIAQSGNTLIIGAGASTGGTSFPNRGAAFIYKSYTTNHYNLIKILKADIPNVYDNYGYAVGIDGSNCIIGVPGDEVSGIKGKGSVRFDNIAE